MTEGVEVLGRVRSNRFLIDQTRQQLADQLARFESFRSKSFASLAVSGTIAAFFGGRLPATSGTLRTIQIASLATTAGLAILLVLPRRFSHGIGPKGYYEWLAGESEDDAITEAHLLDSTARDVVDSWQRNEGRLGCAALLFFAQCVALGVQVVTWLFILHEVH